MALKVRVVAWRMVDASAIATNQNSVNRWGRECLALTAGPPLAGQLAVLGLESGWATFSADGLALTSGAGQTGLIGQPSAQPLGVAVRDANGAVVAGRAINWKTTLGSCSALSPSQYNLSLGTRIDF